MTELKIREVDAYVFQRSEAGIRFLLLKRSRTKIYEHLWQGVAGKIEAGEQAWQTAIRELKEETGLTPKHMFVGDYVGRFYEAHDDRINLVPVFGIEVDSDQVTLSPEHVKYKWVNLPEALKTLVWRGQKEGIQTVHDMLISNAGRMRWSEIELKHRNVEAVK